MKKIIRKTSLIFGIVLSLLIGGCYSELRDLQLGDLQWSPELGVPLVDSKFTLVDILEANANDIDVSTNAENTVVISISDDSLFSQFATDYFSLSDKTLNLPPFMLTQEEINEFNANGEVIVNREVMVDYPNEGDLDRILIDQGTVETLVTENFPADVNLTLEIEDPNSNPILDYTNFFGYDGFDPINSDQSSDQFNNIGFVFNAEPSAAQVKVVFTVTLNRVDQDLIFGANSIDITVSTVDLQFGALYGDLGSEEISTEENTIRTDAFSQTEFLNEIDYYFEDPQFRVTFKNSMGMPVQFNINNFTSYKDGQATDEPINSVVEVPASNEGSTTESGADFDNIFKNIINNVPDSVSLQIDGLIDPGNNTSENYVTKDSYFQGGYEVNLPLEFRLSGLEINETVSLEGIDPQELQYALFKFTSENSLPFDLTFKADLLDADSGFVMNLFDGKFLAAGTEQNPGTTGGIEDLIKLQDDPDTPNNELEDLINVRRVGIQATLSTKNNGTEVVTITEGAAVQFNLAVQAKYNVNF